MNKHGLDLFCASPASTAICSNVDHRSIVRPGPATRRHHHSTRLGDTKTNTTSSLINNNNKNIRETSQRIRDNYKVNTPHQLTTTPRPGSSTGRHLLNNIETNHTHKFFDLLSDSDHLKTIHVVPEPEINSPPPNYSTRPHRDQVVELMVSIHCKGCEGKVRRHISRLEGVKSIHIDLASKKVTVVGDVTPLQVLASISRVKSAQFWPHSQTSSTTSPLFSPSQN